LVSEEMDTDSNDADFIPESDSEEEDNFIEDDDESTSGSDSYVTDGFFSDNDVSEPSDSSSSDDPPSPVIDPVFYLHNQRPIRDAELNRARPSNAVIDASCCLEEDKDQDNTQGTL